ncbi:hypothetical protein KSW81_001143 [Nannochloris sp. 'desiccata']|nr:hypothetical protein KSW81_001143 [Chlorella desiccata (nom. nud.)]
MTPEYADDILPARRPQSVVTLMTAAGYPQPKAEDVAEALAPFMKEEDLVEGDILRIGLLQRGEEVRLVRFSLYHRTDHIATLAPAMMSGRDLPRVYDGIYRAALSYGMNQDLTAQVVRLLAANVDFQAQLKSTDMLEAVFSDPEDGSIDYFDENGKSIRQFLLRNPVPNGPLHLGLRHAPSPRSSAIRACIPASTGPPPAARRSLRRATAPVEKAGWASGYGNQTMIRHANGYVTSYNHQSGIAKGNHARRQIKQGQVIGYVGSTGSSTGSHLHYELIVNGTKVDAMKVRLPGGKALDGPGARLLPAGKAADRHAPAVRRSPGPGREPLRR